MQLETHIFFLLAYPFIVYPFIVDHYCLSFYFVDHFCLSFYCRPLLFIFLVQTIIVYPFIVDHCCLSFQCRPLLFILLLLTIVVYLFTADPNIFYAKKKIDRQNPEISLRFHVCFRLQQFSSFPYTFDRCLEPQIVLHVK